MNEKGEGYGGASRAKPEPERWFMAVFNGWTAAAFFFFQAEDGIRAIVVTGVQTCALPICLKTFLIFILIRRELKPRTIAGSPPGASPLLPAANTDRKSVV